MPAEVFLTTMALAAAVVKATPSAQMRSQRHRERPQENNLRHPVSTICNPAPGATLSKPLKSNFQAMENNECNITRVDTDDLAAFRALLSVFVSLPKESRSRTFLQVAGYTHYENVWSNMLAFFLRPEEKHGLGTLMIESLIALHTDGFDLTVLGNVEVFREVHTSGGKIIDLVIETDTCVVGLENKVHHWVANDLCDYASEVSKRAGDLPCLKFVLGIRRENGLGGDFRSITYRDFWQIVCSRLGSQAMHADPRWLQHLLDFIKTTETFSPSGKMQLTEQDRFFIENFGSSVVSA